MKEVQKGEFLGKCMCGKDIFSHQLFTEDDEGTLYHFSCYNEKVKEEADKNE